MSVKCLSGDEETRKRERERENERNEHRRGGVTPVLVKLSLAMTTHSQRVERK